MKENDVSEIAYRIGYASGLISKWLETEKDQRVIDKLTEILEHLKQAAETFYVASD